MAKFLSMPYLVQKAVLQRMGLIELYDFSRLSKRMKNKVKKYVRIRNVELSIFIDKVVGFHFFSKEDRSRPLCIFNNEALASFWNPINGYSQLSLYLQGTRIVYKELVELFSVPTVYGTLNLDDVGSEYRSAVKLLNEFGPCHVQIYGENVDFQTYMWTLEHLSPMESLNYEAKPVEYLELGLSTLNHECIILLHGFWVRPEHLELMPAAKEIFMEDSCFTGTDINQFFLRLKSGSNPNLERAQLLLRETYEDDDVLDGLDAVEKEDKQEFNYMMELDNGDSCEFTLAVHGNGGGMIQVKINRTKNAQ